MNTIRISISSDPFISCMDWMSRGPSNENQFVYVTINEKKQWISITEETEEYTRRFQIPIDVIEVPNPIVTSEFRVYLSKMLQIKERFSQRFVEQQLRFEFRNHTLTVYKGKQSIMIPIERVSREHRSLHKSVPASAKHSNYRSAFAIGQWVLTEEMRHAIEHSDKPTLTIQIRNQMVHMLGFRNEAFADTSFEVEVRRENIIRFFHGLELPCPVSFDLTENGPVRFRTLESNITREMEMASITIVPVFVPSKRPERLERFERPELPALSVQQVFHAVSLLAKLLQEPFPLRQDLLFRVESGRVLLAGMANGIRAQVDISFDKSYPTNVFVGVLKGEEVEEFCKNLQSSNGSELSFDGNAQCINMQGVQTHITTLATDQWPFPDRDSLKQQHALEFTLGKVRYFSNVIRNQTGRIFAIESLDGMVQILIDDWMIRKKRMSESFADVRYELPFEQIQTIVHAFENTDAVIRFSNAYVPEVCFTILYNRIRYTIFLHASGEHTTNSAGELSTGIYPVKQDQADTISDSEVFEHTDCSTQRASLSELFEQMDQWIGLTQIKDQCIKLVKYVEYERKRSKVIQSQEIFPALHMCFTGNPGTGKTMTARMLGKLFKDIGVLEKGHVVEVDRQKLIGQHIGHSEANFSKYLQQAIGGILFIDEAHSLYKQDSPKDFGHDLIHVLVKAME